MEHKGYPAGEIPETLQLCLQSHEECCPGDCLAFVAKLDREAVGVTAPCHSHQLKT